MDIFFNNIALFITALVAIMAFFIYSFTVIHRYGALAYFTRLGMVVKRGGSTLAGFAGALVGFLAASADTSEEDDDTDKGDLTGIYNFRTRKYDNGTDPHGWYEEDL
ncbi:MAG: hypothetical protein U1B30_11810 [Pseudomonadota bacterium]|jgi:hypothetical protein|nr:hypothetical protein [Pseudomonadota bacterium]